MEQLPFVVADIGGTNARFGLVTARDATTGQFDIEQIHVLPCAEFATFEAVLGAYIERVSGDRPHAACIAIAGPVTGDRIKMTNLSWEFSVETVRKQFQLSNLEVINDFGAQAYATLYMADADLPVVKEGDSLPTSPRAILGPGTGLGVAGLINQAGRWYPLCGEGGHITYAPTSDIEVAIREVIEPSGKHVSVEKFVSGPGLKNIYTALAAVKDQAVDDISPGQISALAMSQESALAVEALNLFFKILGSAAADVTLVMGAWGGVYLGGGILPKVESQFHQGPFIDSFVAKGRMGAILEKVPVRLMKGDKPALAGAAHWLYDSRN